MFSTYHLVPLTSIFYQIACISKTWFYHIFQNISEKNCKFSVLSNPSYVNTHADNLQYRMLKVFFFRTYNSFFKFPILQKKNITKNYPEL